MPSQCIWPLILIFSFIIFITLICVCVCVSQYCFEYRYYFCQKTLIFEGLGTKRYVFWIYMNVYLCAKSEVSSIVLTSFRRGNPPTTTSKRTPKNPTQIRAKVWKLFRHSFIVSDILVQKLRRLGWRNCLPPKNCRVRQTPSLFRLKNGKTWRDNLWHQMQIDCLDVFTYCLRSGL